MLEIHPLTDEKERSSYLSQNHLSEDAAVLRAYENGEITGNISLTLETQLVGWDALGAFNTFESASIPVAFAPYFVGEAGTVQVRRYGESSLVIYRAPSA